MTELSFAKSFLSTLDSRPIKLQSDYAADPRTFEPKGSYTLPRMPHPMRGPGKASAPGSAPSLTVSLKSLRNPPLDIKLPEKSLTTSILELKQAVAERIGAGGTDKIRLLHNKKPCADSKSIKDVIGDEAAKDVEFSVMVMGGVAAAEEREREAPSATSTDVRMDDAPVAQGVAGVEVMQSPEFWDDLKGFLIQRVRDEAVAEKAWDVFQTAWRAKGP